MTGLKAFIIIRLIVHCSRIERLRKASVTF